MQQKLLYLPGALAGLIFFAAVYSLAPMLDGYSHLSQTVSEIGRQGSPAEAYLQAANLTVALCLLAFAWGLYLFARANDVSKLPAFFVACYALAEMGVAAFPTPHQLHNVFGLSMMIGYMAPLVLAVSLGGLAEPTVGLIVDAALGEAGGRPGSFRLDRRRTKL